MATAKTFLQLCQFMASKTGTISGTLPLTVLNQSARLKKVVVNTALAWRTIQGLQQQWLWMRKDFTKALTIGSTEYAGVTTFSIADFGRWVTDPGTITIYDPAIGVGDESELTKISWAEFRVRYLKGTQNQNRPGHYAISPQNALRIGVVPDKAYVIRGEYYTAVQDLAADADVPLLPADYHDMIAYRALMFMAEDDEAVAQLSTATAEYARLMSVVETTQLPEITTDPEPIA